MKKVIKTNSTICILGGMGPQASARLLTLIVEKASVDLHLPCEDFPEIIVDSVPVPDFVSNLKNKEVALSMLRKRVKKLNVFHPDIFCISCNTAHLFLNDLQACTKSPFVSLISAITNEVEKRKIIKVGIMATPVTIKTGLYQKSLSKVGIEAIVPNNQELRKIELIIRNTLGCKASIHDPNILLGVADSLKAQGAGGIILGCTELPLIFPENFDLPVFDSLAILSDVLLERTFRKETSGRKIKIFR